LKDADCEQEITYDVYNGVRFEEAFQQIMIFGKHESRENQGGAVIQQHGKQHPEAIIAGEICRRLTPQGL